MTAQRSGAASKHRTYVTLRPMTDTTNFNQTVIDEFRANGGKVGGGFAGMPMVIITTKGAKSGQARVNPLAALVEDDGTLYIFASKGRRADQSGLVPQHRGQPRGPGRVRGRRVHRHATVLTGAKRTEIYDRQKTLVPGFADYEAGTTRVIPVVALTRKELIPQFCSAKGL